jgi:hypothetical protein
VKADGDAVEIWWFWEERADPRGLDDPFLKMLGTPRKLKLNMKDGCHLLATLKLVLARCF